MDTAAYEVDTHFYTRRVDKVEPLVQPHGAPMAWMIQCEGAWISCEDREGVGVPPVAGESARFYGYGSGYPVRGIVIGGRVYSYRSQLEVQQLADADKAQRRAENRQRFDARRAQFDRDVAALPEPLRQRMAWFMENPAWAPEFGAYELFVCTEAALFAGVLQTPEAVQAFVAMPLEKQIVRVPVMSEGHTGHTFQVACALAYALLHAPETVPRAHGAMCGIVGCTDYGCWAASGARTLAAAKDPRCGRWKCPGCGSQARIADGTAPSAEWEWVSGKWQHRCPSEDEPACAVLVVDDPIAD